VRNTCPWYLLINLTLPLTKESVPHHFQLIFERYKFSSPQSFSEVFCYLLNNGYKLKLNCPSLNIIPDKVISNLYVFRPVMENWILKEFYATLIVRINHHGPQLHTKYPNQQLVKPYGLIDGLIGFHILNLNRNKSHLLFLLTEPRHNC
jgi:hypothetical protein